MDIRKLENWGEVESYRQPWHNILTEIKTDTVFMTFDWMQTWWEHHGINHELYILMMIEKGEVLGFVPLMRERGKLYDTIGFVGGSEASYMGIIARDKDKEKAIVAALDHILGLQGRLLFRIHGLLKDTQDYPLIKRYLSKNKIKFLETTRETYYTKVSGKNFEGYIRKRLSRSSRHNIRRNDKRLRRLGDVSFEPLGTDLKDIRAVFAIHDKRWQRKVGSSKFSKGETKNFFKGLALSPNLAFTTNIDVIRLNNKIIAFVYGFKYGGKYICYRIGHDDDFGIFSPGEMVLREKIRDCFEKDFEVFDLGPGYEFYKTRWGMEKNYTVSFLFLSSHRLSKIVCAPKKWGRNIKDWIKGHQRVCGFITKTLGSIKYMLLSYQCVKGLKRGMLNTIKTINRKIASIYSVREYRVMELPIGNKRKVEMPYKIREVNIDDLGKIASISHREPSHIIRQFLNRERCLLGYVGSKDFCLWYNTAKIDLGKEVYFRNLSKNSLYISEWTPKLKGRAYSQRALETIISYLQKKGYTKVYIALCGKKPKLYSMLKNMGFKKSSHLKVTRKIGKVYRRGLK